MNWYNKARQSLWEEGWTALKQKCRVIRPLSRRGRGLEHYAGTTTTVTPGPDVATYRNTIKQRWRIWHVYLRGRYWKADLSGSESRCRIQHSLASRKKILTQLRVTDAAGALAKTILPAPLYWANTYRSICVRQVQWISRYATSMSENSH